MFKKTTQQLNARTHTNLLLRLYVQKMRSFGVQKKRESGYVQTQEYESKGKERKKKEKTHNIENQLER